MPCPSIFSFFFFSPHRFNISYCISSIKYRFFFLFFFSFTTTKTHTHTMNPHSNSSNKKQILSRIESAFRVTDSQLNDLVLGFNEEMKAGLDITNRATKGSELKMIPSYVTGINGACVRASCRQTHNPLSFYQRLSHRQRKGHLSGAGNQRCGYLRLPSEIKRRRWKARHQSIPIQNPG